MSRKKILFLASWYPNRYHTTHGIFVQRHAEAVAEFCDVSAMHVRYAPGLEKRYDLVAEHINNVYTVIIYYRKVQGFPPGLQGLIKFIRYKRAHRIGYAHLKAHWGDPQLLHLYIIWKAGIFALWLTKKLGIPMVIQEQWSGYLPEDGTYRGFLRKRITQQCVKRAKKFIAISQRMIDALKGHQLNSDFTIAYNVIDTELFKPAPQQEERPVRFVHVSTVNDREKNISGMLRTLAEVRKSHQNFTFEVYGDSDELDHFKALAKELDQLEYVLFKGFQPPEAIAAAMQQCDCLLMFSNYEGLPCVLVEGMATGMPAIATTVGSIPQVVDEQKGLLVAPGDEAGLKAAIIKFIEDPAQYDRSAIANYASANFSYRAVGSQLNSIYEAVLQ